MGILLSNASAGGQDEQPCEVNSSTTTGRAPAPAGPAANADPAPSIKAANRTPALLAITASPVALGRI